MHVIPLHKLFSDLMQLINLNDSLENPESLYFILDNESASERRDVVKQGWATKLPSEYVSKLYGRMQSCRYVKHLTYG